LNYLLEASDSNPITILARSPHPWRGLGKQIAAELRELLDIAKETVDE
jgi:hypothetical protein